MYQNGMIFDWKYTRSFITDVFVLPFPVPVLEKCASSQKIAGFLISLIIARAGIICLFLQRLGSAPKGDLG
jgi:hypothetical protein